MSVEEAIKNSFVQEIAPATYEYHIAADFPAFEGHFEGNALLPAVCQLGLCAAACSRLLGKPMEIASVVRAKFMRPILPQSGVQIKLSPRQDGTFLVELSSMQNSVQKYSQIICRVKECV